MTARDGHSVAGTEDATQDLWAAAEPGVVDWAYLYERHSHSLRRLIARRVPRNGPVDDILNETFARAIRSTRLIDTQRPAWPFLATVAGRAVADWWQREGARPYGELGAAAATGDFPGSDEHALALDRAVATREALLAMKPRQRRALYLYAAADCSYETLTETEQLSVQAMKSLLGRARGCFQARYRELLAGDAAFGLAAWLRTASRRLRIRLNPVSVSFGLEGLLALSGVVAASVIIGTAASPAKSTSLVRSGYALPPVAVALPGSQLQLAPTDARPDPAVQKTEADRTELPGEERPVPTTPPPSFIEAGSVIVTSPESSTASFWVTIEKPILHDETTIGMETRCDQGEIANRRCQALRLLPGSG